MDHILSDLSTMTHPSCVAPTAWLSLFELDKAVVHALTSNAEEAEVERLYEDLQDLLELTLQKDVLFIIGD